MVNIMKKRGVISFSFSIDSINIIITHNIFDFIKIYQDNDIIIQKYIRWNLKKEVQYSAIINDKLIKFVIRRTIGGKWSFVKYFIFIDNILIYKTEESVLLTLINK